MLLLAEIPKKIHPSIPLYSYTRSGRTLMHDKYTTYPDRLNHDARLSITGGPNNKSASFTRERETR